MRTKHILILTALAFLTVSIYSGLKIRQVKKLTRETTELQVKFDQAQTEKNKLLTDNRTKAIELAQLSTQKQAIEKELEQYKAETQKQITGFKMTISQLTSLPADTVYQIIFSKWPTYNGVLKFRFAENQIREMHLNILERDHYLSLSEKIGQSLNACTELNIQNDGIISNLTDQNTNLNGIISHGNGQISDLKGMVELRDKQVKKVKRNAWIWKGVAVVSIVGILVK